MHRSLMVMKWEWTQLVFLYFMVSGTRSLVTVQQPPVLTTALGRDVIMPCHLTLSHDENMMIPPVLYWVYITQNNTDNPKLWTPSGEYDGRVDLVDHEPLSPNKSIVLKNVQWADGGKYLCKLSITTERDKSFRKKGNQSLLVVYDTMIFNLTGHNDSLLWCEVNVTRDAGFVLSIVHDGWQLQHAGSAGGDNVTDLPYVTLSETVSLQKQGQYECQLHLNGDLITKSIFYYHVPVAEGGGDVKENVPLTCPTIVSGPWLLYTALLLVPVIILVGLGAALLMYRRCTGRHSDSGAAAIKVPRHC